MSTSLRRASRRLVAIAMLTAFGLPPAAPLLATGRAPMECPDASSNAPRAALVVTSAPVSTCQHAHAAPCVSPVGCVTLAPALRASQTAFAIFAALVALGMAPIAPKGDLFRAGPPTPPPNSI